jgi:CubicO group peptidase (beta-lactamase class C family)
VTPKALPGTVVLLSLVGCYRGGERAVPPEPAFVESSLPAVLDSARIPGLVMAVVSDAETGWTSAFGVTATPGGVPMDEHTVFEAASLSKPVTAYAALRFVDRGLLSLDKPLAGYLPHPELANDPRAAAITLRNVLTHSSGLPNERIGDAPLRFESDPGTAFRYSGEAFRYLGAVMEKVAGASFNDIMTREVFGPFGMTRSSFLWHERFAPNAALGHDMYGDAKTPSRPVTAKPQASLHTTAHDYARFLTAVMKGGGLSPALHQQLMVPQIAVANDLSWSLGWGLEQTADGPALFHHGDNSNSGFTAFAVWYPRVRRGLVYFANSNAGLSITARLLQVVGAPYNRQQAALNWMGYAPYNSRAQLARLEIEGVIRSLGVMAGLARLARLTSTVPALASDETLLNSLGYRFLAAGRATDAIAIFQANVERFPSSFNVHDSLGEAYASVGDYEAALKSYMKAVELNPQHAHGITMIRELKSKLGR